MCCAPSCVGRCGGSDGCVGSCPNNCVSPQTCGGGGTPNVCGSPACGTLNVSGFSVQASSNGVYTRVGNTLVWENATRTIQYGMITSTYWEILQKPGAPGPSRPAICDKPTGAGASPAACSSGWLEWTGSASGFVSVPAVMTCQ